MPGILFLLLILLNLATCLAFRSDKIAATRNLPRFPEATLLWLAALGGTPGAYAGRRLFRHKTRKQPFTARLHGIAALQCLLLTLALWQLR